VAAALVPVVVASVSVPVVAVSVQVPVVAAPALALVGFASPAAG
jgi:hypothetical protein